jgi:hypothetical protein
MTQTNAIKFKVDPVKGTVTGPADYLDSDYFRRCIDMLNRGQSAVFNYGAHAGHETCRLIEIVLQTDYAAWRGQRQLAAMDRS